MQEIILEDDILKAKKGDTYVRGLFGIPDLYSTGGTIADDWWWKKDSLKADNDFIFYRNIPQLNPNPEIPEQPVPTEEEIVAQDEIASQEAEEQANQEGEFEAQQQAEAEIDNFLNDSRSE